MTGKPETFTPNGVMAPIGPYSHVAAGGGIVALSATAGVDPETQELAGPDVASQTARVIKSFEIMLAAAGSDLDHVLHVTVFLTDMADFAAMNAAYEKAMGGRRPARSAIGVAALPKPGACVTMNALALKKA